MGQRPVAAGNPQLLGKRPCNSLDAQVLEEQARQTLRDSKVPFEPLDPLNFNLSHQMHALTPTMDVLCIDQPDLGLVVSELGRYKRVHPINLLSCLFATTSAFMARHTHAVIFDLAEQEPRLVSNTG